MARRTGLAKLASKQSRPRSTTIWSSRHEGPCRLFPCCSLQRGSRPMRSGPPPSRQNLPGSTTSQRALSTSLQRQEDRQSCRESHVREPRGEQSTCVRGRLAETSLWVCTPKGEIKRGQCPPYSASVRKRGVHASRSGQDVRSIEVSNKPCAEPQLGAR